MNTRTDTIPVTDAPRDLVQLFVDLVREIPGAEWVDDLRGMLPHSLFEGEHGDFLLDRRSIIGELKSLETDTRHKIDPILEPLRTSPDWPQFFGSWNVEEVLATMPGGAEVMRRIEKAVTSAIPGIVRKANRQIAETKRVLELGSAEGFLVVLNAGLELLSPRTIAEKIIDCLKEDKQPGRPKFRHIQHALVISESHVIVTRSGDPRLPLLSIRGRGASDRGTRSASALMQAWARRTGLPMVPGETAEGARLETASEYRARSQSAPLHEIWRREYRRHRTLQQLSDEELLTHGARVVAKVRIGKSGKIEMPEDPLPMGREFTEFLEEIRFRRIPLQRWGPRVASISRDLNPILDSKHWQRSAGQEASSESSAEEDPGADGIRPRGR